MHELVLIITYFTSKKYGDEKLLIWGVVNEPVFPVSRAHVGP